MSTQYSEVLLIGVGNEYRGDDALGLCVARGVSGAGAKGICVVETTGDGASLMKMWEGCESVIIVDAMKFGFPPGSIHRIDASRQSIPVGFFAYSSHAFGVGQSIELARQINQLPPSLVIYGMEGERFDFGTELSVSVKESLPVLINIVLSELNGRKES